MASAVLSRHLPILLGQAQGSGQLHVCVPRMLAWLYCFCQALYCGEWISSAELLNLLGEPLALPVPSGLLVRTLVSMLPGDLVLSFSGGVGLARVTPSVCLCVHYAGFTGPGQEEQRGFTSAP